jgi:hypothetical protein
VNTTDTGPRLALDIGARATVITAASGATWTLPVGTASLWPLSEHGPSALAVENGIQTVEDAIERIADQVPRGARMVLSARSLAPLQRGGAIAALAQGSIGLDGIEHEYQLLAARAVGAPSARGTGFDGAAGDAVLLILRELMHHLGLRSLHGPD